jgi:hypothetical protein
MSASLLEPEHLPPPNPWPKRIAVSVVVLALAGGLLYWRFRYYEEEKVVTSFMDALVAGDYQQAYQIWNPVPTYTFENFLEDWGETTSFGRIRSYEIVGVRSSSGMLLRVPVEGTDERRTLRVGGRSSGVVVSVRINGQEPPERLWVETDPPRLSFPPF